MFQATDPGTGRLTMMDRHPRRRRRSCATDAPGDDAIDSYTSSCALLPADKIAELEYPWRVERTEQHVDKFGGRGLATAAASACDATTALLAHRAEGMYYVEQLDPRFAAAGRRGGGPGAPGRGSLIRAARAGEWEPVARGKGYLHLARGDVVAFVGAGGGGYGRSRSSPST